MRMRTQPFSSDSTDGGRTASQGMRSPLRSAGGAQDGSCWRATTQGHHAHNRTLGLTRNPQSTYSPPDAQRAPPGRPFYPTFPRWPRALPPPSWSRGADAVAGIVNPTRRRSAAAPRAPKRQAPATQASSTPPSRPRAPRQSHPAPLTPPSRPSRIARWFGRKQRRPAPTNAAPLPDTPDAPFTPEAYPGLTPEACALLNTPVEDCDPDTLRLVLSVFATRLAKAPALGGLDANALFATLCERLGAAPDSPAPDPQPDAAPSAPTGCRPSRAAGVTGCAARSSPDRLAGSRIVRRIGNRPGSGGAAQASGPAPSYVPPRRPLAVPPRPRPNRRRIARAPTRPAARASALRRLYRPALKRRARPTRRAEPERYARGHRVAVPQP